MYPLFETVRIEDGVPRHLGWHNERAHRSRLALFGSRTAIDLGERIREALSSRGPSDDLVRGTARCRVTYGEEPGDVTLSRYEPRRIASLELVDGSGLGYAHKYVDRSGIERLAAAAAADDILIVKDGLVTDASYANVAFWDGAAWWTPSTPLLAGTVRARLLDLGLLRARPIAVAEIGSFLSVALVNAMIGLDASRAVPVREIRGL